MPKPPAGRPAGVPKPYRRAGSQKWQVKVKVPLAAGGPGQIARSLETADYAEALRRAPVVVAQIRREIESRRRNADGTRKDQKGDLTEEQRKAAAWWAEHRLPDPTRDGRFTIPDHLEPQWEADVARVLGDPLPAEPGQDEERFDPAREAAALELIELTTGERVPVNHELTRYLEQEGIKASYESRTRNALTRLSDWMRQRPQGDNLHAVTPRLANTFADHLAAGEIATATLNSLLSALSAYWAWMLRRQLVASNPWTGMQRKVVKRDRNADKRPFTDDEVKALLTGDASRTLHDMMRVAALSGMRLNEIGNLRVADVEADAFVVRVSKTTAGRRAVPVHPDLAPLVALRTAGKAPTDFLFEELTAPPSRPERRGGKVGDRFTAYRRALGLDARKDGRRQSDIDFHSFRRWFITKAEQADQPIHVIQATVGHKREGVTLGTYSGGPSLDQRRKVVESVRLPEGVTAASPEGPLMVSQKGDSRKAPQRVAERLVALPGPNHEP